MAGSRSSGRPAARWKGRCRGSNDVFIRRYDFAGGVLWTRQFGTAGQDWATDVAADANGLTVLGATDGSFSGTGRNDANDLFVRRYDRAGTVLWTTPYVTPKDEQPGGIAADGSGLTVVGTTQGVPEDILGATGGNHRGDRAPVRPRRPAPVDPPVRLARARRGRRGRLPSRRARQRGGDRLGRLHHRGRHGRRPRRARIRVRRRRSPMRSSAATTPTGTSSGPGSGARRATTRWRRSQRMRPGSRRSGGP